MLGRAPEPGNTEGERREIKGGGEMRGQTEDRTEVGLELAVEEGGPVQFYEGVVDAALRRGGGDSGEGGEGDGNGGEGEADLRQAADAQAAGNREQGEDGGEVTRAEAGASLPVPDTSGDDQHLDERDGVSQPEEANHGIHGNRRVCR